MQKLKQYITNAPTTVKINYKNVLFTKRSRDQMTESSTMSLLRMFKHESENVFDIDF